MCVCVCVCVCVRVYVYVCTQNRSLLGYTKQHIFYTN